MVHQSDPNKRPDTDYQPAELRHIVSGNRGRLLDARRTPVSFQDVDLNTGQFSVRIEGFEDKGAIWWTPLEKVRNYQVEKGAAVAPSEFVDQCREVIARLDHPLEVTADSTRLPDTRRAVEAEAVEARRWLESSSTFLAGGAVLDPAARRGDPRLFADFEAFMAVRGVADMEATFATQFVSNPYSGEMVKGHRIVLARLGLVTFRGRKVRDPRLFDGDWSEERRGRHVVARLGFLQALFARLGIQRLTLYRGLYSESVPRPTHNETFVSSSTNFEVAHSCYFSDETSMWGLIMRQPTAVDRIFMSYFETAAMNRQFEESEVVLLYDPNAWF